MDGDYLADRKRDVLDHEEVWSQSHHANKELRVASEQQLGVRGVVSMALAHLLAAAVHNTLS